VILNGQYIKDEIIKRCMFKNTCSQHDSRAEIYTTDDNSDKITYYVYCTKEQYEIAIMFLERGRN
jgi:hypothetical protein